MARTVRDAKIQEIARLAEFGPPPPAAEGAGGLDGIFLSHGAKDAARLLLDGGGTSAYKADSPVRRIAGDLAMMSTHVLGSDYDVLIDRNARWALGLGMGAGDPAVRITG
jgi:3-hydroxy-9,10-secoandrosta-1,3,5(10)-triene-9,17-dione monooxygenase